MVGSFRILRLKLVGIVRGRGVGIQRFGAAGFRGSG